MVDENKLKRQLACLSARLNALEASNQTFYIIPNSGTFPINNVAVIIKYAAQNIYYGWHSNSATNMDELVTILNGNAVYNVLGTYSKDSGNNYIVLDMKRSIRNEYPGNITILIQPD